MLKLIVVVFSLFFGTMFAEAGGFQSYLLMANTPDSQYGKTAGLDVFALRDDNFGFYLRLQNNNNGPRKGYFDNMEITDNSDQVTARYRDSAMYVMGTTKSVTSFMSVYLGAGYAKSTGYADKVGYVPALSGVPAHTQAYTVNDTGNTNSKVFVDAGILMYYGVFSIGVGRNSFSNENNYSLGFKIDMNN